MSACYWETYEERKRCSDFPWIHFTELVPSHVPGQRRLAMDGGVPYSIGVTMTIKVWLLLPGSLPCVFCVIVCLMFIVRSVLVLDLWFSSFILNTLLQIKAP